MFEKSNDQQLSELNEEYWRRGRFSNCEVLGQEEETGVFEVLEQEETGVFTLAITVDHDKLLPEHQNLPRDFYLWVLNRQLNLQEIGCATLAGTSQGIFSTLKKCHKHSLFFMVQQCSRDQ
ncbi:hypothetical protein T265_04708 [Opisthorchis viverrini]|uniref:Uncharacterized protein n=1 Tax=Opisthorchis viverrini TaxID=6198 RepID=A0A075AG80_OPIVI|nr:hypothetical protein T265_04708 [Opisthorchis viverrini]KER28484.1 hypothetical protein T265_04708 [Opisthorchis viverrini]